MTTKAWLLGLVMSLGMLLPVHADTGDLSMVIERFVVSQFPEAAQHFWVVNGTQWQTDVEVVVDVNTVTVAQAGQAPAENRFLLLIVSGKLAGAQNIPLDSQPECQPEQQA